MKRFLNTASADGSHSPFCQRAHIDPYTSKSSGDGETINPETLRKRLWRKLSGRYSHVNKPVLRGQALIEGRIVKYRRKTAQIVSAEKCLRILPVYVIEVHAQQVLGGRNVLCPRTFRSNKYPGREL